MKRVASLLILFMLAVGLFSFPAGVKASCVCYTDGGQPVDLVKSTGLDTDDECNQACVAESDTYVSGKAASDETLQDQATYQATTQLDQRLADGTCSCFCGTDGIGAGAMEGTYQTSGECKDTCDGLGWEFSICATSSAQLPLANGLCWSQEDCSASGGEWGDQPAECASGDHYCYPPSQAVELSVHIGETTQVFNIGSYINVIYTYGLGAASIIAVVMIMIGGAQYIIGSRGGGGSEEVSKAKDRIRNAAVGLVLLLVIYAILYTVNPALTVFKTIELPKIKPSLFVEGSCEDYGDKGYGVEPAEEKEECGYEGIIVSDPNGIDISQTCIYDTCAAGAQCGRKGPEYACQKSAALDADAVKEGFKVSDANCSLFTPEADSNKPDQHDLCMVVQDQEALGFDQDICALVSIDCSSIGDCWAYADASVGGGTGGIQGSEAYDKAFYNVCTQNPCKNKVGACTPIDKEELGGVLGASLSADLLREEYADDSDASISKVYVLSESDVSSLSSSIPTTFSVGGGDVACAPAYLIK